MQRMGWGEKMESEMETVENGVETRQSWKEERWSRARKSVGKTTTRGMRGTR
jgi:hypothetical protein